MLITRELCFWTVPLLLGLASLAVGRRDPLQHAQRISALALSFSLIAGGVGAWLVRSSEAADSAAQPLSWKLVMLVLVSGLGVVISRYARSYLAGDPNVQRFARWLLFVLASVSVLVVANDFLVLALSWTATSIGLQPLLTHEQDRLAARITAHKKFVLSRIADVVLWTGLALVCITAQSTNIREVLTYTMHEHALPWSVHLGSVLVVLAVVIKSAQMPFHGWLMQVMEAPTPVSALLHAGVVNMGGWLLIRLAPWMDRSPIAQVVLLAAGLSSAVLAAWIMNTRASIKEKLAWSTCAQMGMMLVMCALGQWSFAALHLVAHSLYKAHGFLSAGTVVSRWLSSTKLKREQWTWSNVATSVVMAALGVGGVLAGMQFVELHVSTSLFWMSVCLVLALVSFNANMRWNSARLMLLGVSGNVVITGLFVLWHHVVEEGLGLPQRLATTLEWAVVVMAMGVLFGVHWSLRLVPRSSMARWLAPRLRAGFWLDERMTAMLFRWWPMTSSQGEKAPSAMTHTVEG